MPIGCTLYTNLDEAVIRQATALKLPLTGGTAPEV